MSIDNHCWTEWHCKAWYGLEDGTGTYLTVLDLVFVHVLGAGGVLADVLILGQLIYEDLATIPAVGLGEAELRGGLLDGEGQLAEGGVRLLAIKRLGQGGQVYNAQTKNELREITTEEGNEMNSNCYRDGCRIEPFSELRAWIAPFE